MSPSAPRRPLRHAYLAALAAALTFAAAPAMGQERYRLAEDAWQQQTEFEPGTPEAAIQQIRRTLRQDEPKQAEKLATAWIEQHELNHPLMPQARLLRGHARSARKAFYDALYDYEQVIRQYPASDAYHEALEQEYRIAEVYLAGFKRKFLGLRILPATGEAEILLIRLQQRAPGTELAQKAMLRLGQHYFDQGEMGKAADVYELFLENYPQSERRQEAMLQLIRANLARFEGPAFDATGLLEAGQRLRQFARQFPAAAEEENVEGQLTRIEHSLARKDFEVARWYEKRGEDVSAAALYQRLIEDYPQTAPAKEAIDRLVALDVPERMKRIASETETE
ncbi:MAG: outer membrane protein assembly factor BamD [Phycisphaeraceae bacterium]